MDVHIYKHREERVLLILISIKHFFSTPTLNAFIYVCFSRTDHALGNAHCNPILLSENFLLPRKKHCNPARLLFPTKAYHRRSVSSFCTKKINSSNEKCVPNRRGFSKLKFFRAYVRQTFSSLT